MFRQWSVCSSTIKDGIVKNQNYHEVGLHPSQQQPSHRADAKLLVVVCTCRAEVFQDVVNLDIAALLAFSENCIGLVLRTNSKTMNGTWTVDNLNLFLDFGRFRAQRGWLWGFLGSRLGGAIVASQLGGDIGWFWGGAGCVWWTLIRFGTLAWRNYGDGLTHCPRE